jgi:N-acetylmuramoyl-L-alanine amidase
VIDAGHGGDDLGAKGAGGTTEKDVTLSVARRLKGAIEARVGLRVLMTRDDDRMVPASDRTAIANNSKADMFISLHANASFRDTVAGATVFVAAFDADQVSANKVTSERLPALGGGLRDIELVPWNLAQIRHKDQSETFATFVVEALKDRVPLAPRPIDHAALRVLESANMPAVLLEVGYLSNAAQEKQIAGNDFQTTLVQGLVDAIMRYRDAVAPAEGTSR